MADNKDIKKPEETTVPAAEEKPKDKNWAEMADESESDDDQEIGVQDDNKQPKPLPVPEEEKKVYAPPSPRSKTNRGDYVVTKISVPDRIVTKKLGKV